MAANVKGKGGADACAGTGAGVESGQGGKERTLHDSWLHRTGRFGGERKDSEIEVGGGGWERKGGGTNRVKPWEAEAAVVGGGKRAHSILKDQDVESGAGIEGETKEVTGGNGIVVSTHPPFLATSSITCSPGWFSAPTPDTSAPFTATHTLKDVGSTTATTTASLPASWHDVHAPAILNDQASNPVQEQGNEREEGKERDTGKYRGCDSIKGSESMNGRGSAPEDIADKTEQSSFVRVVINRASGQCRGAASAAGRRQGAERGDGKMRGESGGSENGGVSTTKFQPKFEGHKFDNDICELFASLRR